MARNSRPIIGITIGDPAGVGPEIVAKALTRHAVFEVAKPLVVGDYRVMQQACRIVGSASKLRAVENPRDVTGEYGVIEVLDLQDVDEESLRMGEVSAMCGKAAYEYIRKAVELALDGEIAAMATGPINKESLRAADIDQIGHTEIIGELTGTEDPLTMFEVDKMRIFFLTRHVSLRKAIDMIRQDRVIDYLRRCTAALTQLGVERRDIAVAGLNPHCGDGGQFGDEDDRELVPAIKAAQDEGLDVHGPIGADSIFHMGVEGRFAAILSLYHDQGHIAAKTYDFYRTVSVTLGMPILRTSVDHGTAFDVAGTGKADAAGMAEAILAAARYAPSFERATVKV